MKQKILKFFVDLRFAILILLLISSFSAIGTIIEQEKPIEIYKLNYPLTNPIFGMISWDKILFFGLDHIYKTWWFYISIILFGMSLIMCTFLQQIPTFKFSQTCQIFRSFKQLKNLELRTFQPINKILSRLKSTKYSIFQQHNLLYCYKGFLGQVGPILVHFSLILILIGTLISSLTSFKSQEIITKGETFHIQNILTDNIFTKIPNISGRVNDFWILYKNENIIDQFYSDISILAPNGNEISRRTGFVNLPIIFNNIYFYQTDWNLTGIRLLQNNFIVEHPLINILKTNNKFWVTWVKLNKISFLNEFILIVNNLQGYCSLYNDKGFFLGNFELNEKINTNQLQLIDIVSSTGLQIKLDPGIYLIYSGFLFLIISSFLSYLTYSQIWFIKQDNTTLLIGNTTRAIFDFEFELYKIQN